MYGTNNSTERQVQSGAKAELMTLCCEVWVKTIYQHLEGVSKGHFMEIFSNILHYERHWTTSRPKKFHCIFHPKEGKLILYLISQNPLVVKPL